MAKTDTNNKASRTREITDEEVEEAERANASGRTPVVFIHGLFLLPSSWDRWAELFKSSGYAPLTPGWPDDPDTVEDALPLKFVGRFVS